VTLSTAGLAAVLASCPGSASTPLVRTAVVAAGGSAPPAVVSLAEGVLSAMRFAKLKLTAAVVCTVVGLAGTGVMVALSQEKKADPKAPADDPKAPPKAEIKEPFETAFPDIKPFEGKEGQCPRFMGKVSVPADPTDLFRRLAKARLDSLVATAAMNQRLIEGGQWDTNGYYSMMQVHRDIPVAAADTLGRTEDIIPWYEEWVSITKGVEQVFEARFRAGNVRRQDVEQARAERFHAERELLKLKQKRGAK
jgi:hypothetical protein